MEYVLKFICDTKEKAMFIAKEGILQQTIENILAHLKEDSRFEIFLNRVGRKEAPGYYEIIKNPMDLGTITKKIPLYKSLDEFEVDLNLIVDNCILYNQAEYYIQCAVEFKATFDSYLMEFRRVFAKEPESIRIEGILIKDPKPEAKKAIAGYLKRVGFEGCEKKCLSILCDILECKIKTVLCRYLRDTNQST